MSEKNIFPIHGPVQNLIIPLQSYIFNEIYWLLYGFSGVKCLKFYSKSFKFDISILHCQGFTFFRTHCQKRITETSVTIKMMTTTMMMTMTYSVRRLFHATRAHIDIRRRWRRTRHCSCTDTTGDNPLRNCPVDMLCATHIIIHR